MKKASAGKPKERNMPRVGQPIHHPALPCGPAGANVAGNAGATESATTLGNAPVVEVPETRGTKSKKPINIRKPQIRIMRCLAQTGYLRSAQVAEKSNVDRSLVTGMLGYENPEQRKRFEDHRNCKSLITWGFVQAESVVIDCDVSDKSERLYFLTLAGKKFLAAACKEYLEKPASDEPHPEH
jgi:hypothetical protein